MTKAATEKDLLRLSTAAVIDAELVAQDAANAPRGHLGMSQIGKEDQRRLWLEFRWSFPRDLPARTLRIFELGRMIESEVVRLLGLVPGLEIHADDGDAQFRFSEVGGHFAGSMDGALRGLVEAPQVWHVLEVKSANAKSFRELLKVGLKEWRPEYWIQAQCYMGAAGLDRCLFVVYCKDDSQLYIKRIRREPMIYPAMIAQAERLIEADAPPESPWPSREFYKARFMSDDQQAVYWGDRLPPSVNCRNCRFARPLTDGDGARWHCAQRDKLLTRREQWAGCQFHNWLPALVPAEPLETHDGDAPAVKYQAADGTKFWNIPMNATPGFSAAFSSDELAIISRQGFNADTLADPLTLQIRGELGARQVDPDATPGG